MDWTWPVAILVFWAGLIAFALVALPRVRLSEELRELVRASAARAHDLAVAFDAFRQKEYAPLKARVDETAKGLATVQSAVAVKQIGR